MTTRPSRLTVPPHTSSKDSKLSKDRSPSSKPSGVVRKKNVKWHKRVSQGKADNGEGSHTRDKQGVDKHEQEKEATDRLTDFSKLMDAPQPAEERSPTWKDTIANTLDFRSYLSSGPTPPTSERTASPTAPKEEQRGRSNPRADGWDKIGGLGGSTDEQQVPPSNSQRVWDPKKVLHSVKQKEKDVQNARRRGSTGAGMHGHGGNDAVSSLHMKSRKRPQNEAKWEEVDWSEVLKSNHPEAKNFENWFKEQIEEQKHLNGYKIFIRHEGSKYAAKVCRPANVESQPQRNKETYRPESNHNTITIQSDDVYWHAVINCQDDLEEYVNNREGTWF